jgi:hypothetical protein
MRHATIRRFGLEWVGGRDAAGDRRRAQEAAYVDDYLDGAATRVLRRQSVAGAIQDAGLDTALADVGPMFIWCPPPQSSGSFVAFAACLGPPATPTS